MRLRWKILLIIAAAALYWKIVYSQPVRPNLKIDYLEYNDRLFYGALPNNVTVDWADLSAQSDLARTETRADGSIAIMIDFRKNPDLRQAKMSLIHEMCHIKIWKRVNLRPGENVELSEGLDGHGPAHEACMLDVAKQGGFKDLW